MLGNFCTRKSLSVLAARFAAAMLGGVLTCSAHADSCTATPVSGKTYYIVNEASGLNLDVLSNKKTDGAYIGQYGSNGRSNQQWKVSDTGSKDSNGNPLWQIVAVSSNKAMDVYALSTADGAPIKQWTINQNANQKWLLKKPGNGGFNIVSAYSQKLVTIGDKKALSTIFQQSDRSSAYQRWYFNPVDGNCPASFGSFMGGNKLLIGGQMEDSTALAAPFPVRYRYIHSQVPKDQSCYKQCSDICKGWWGCWSDSQWNHEAGLSLYQVKTPPKTMVTSLIDGQTQDEIMHWTWYSLRDLGDQAGYGDGPGEVNAVNDARLLKGYMDDYRFFLQKIGNAKNIIHLEPDFWGYVNSINSNPHLVPAKVAAANPTDCATEENSASGLAKCLISMARKYAPNAAVGLHTSCWNWNSNGGPAKCVQFYKDLGASRGDMLVTDASDRDAGWYEIVKNQPWHWWDDSGFAAYLAYIKLLTEGVGKPMIIWQIPLGNKNMNNTKNHYKDNKVEYLFSRTSDVVNAHIVALLFGSGEGDQTYPESDGGYLVGKTQDYWRSGGSPLR